MGFLRSLFGWRTNRVFDDTGAQLSPAGQHAVFTRSRRQLGTRTLVETFGNQHKRLALRVNCRRVPGESRCFLRHRVRSESDYRWAVVRLRHAVFFRLWDLAALGSGQSTLGSHFGTMLKVGALNPCPTPTGVREEQRPAAFRLYWYQR